MRRPTSPRHCASPRLVADTVITILLVAGCTRESPSTPGGGGPGGGKSARSASAAPSLETYRLEEDRRLFATYAGSASCEPCHEEAWNDWEGSHHALAERPFFPEIDREAFDPPREFEHGSMVSSVRMRGDEPQIVTQGFSGKKPFRAERVFGVDPLRQFLVEAPGGRLQATELAWDPNEKEWFDVYGNEDRRPGEWGHWTGRGMTWNVMCAGCHNTRLRKNYIAGRDAYATRAAEMGVGCEACHGPMADHVAWQNERAAGREALAEQEREAYDDEAPPDPTLAPLSRAQHLDNCGYCHARRVELTGDFVPGDLFLDNVLPVIPDETDIYYADGQVREEDYEYVSFLGSRMHMKGVNCVDCHNIHSGKTKYNGNGLCLQCHWQTIDPVTHGHHELETPGSLCVDCHMPLTTYMQRHPRRDHGFTIPDPMLTKEHGIPNACDRCHADKGTDWSLEAVREWYGEPEKRPSQQRARWVYRAKQGDVLAIDPLIAVSRDDEIDLWRAVASGLLRRWATEPRVRDVLLERAVDPNPLVRSVAARSLEPTLGHPDAGGRVEKTLLSLLDDPVRAVRVQSAWSLRSRVDPLSPAGKDLFRFLEINLDQPSGLLQMAVYNMDRGYYRAAIPLLDKAVVWDANSAPLRQVRAVCLSNLGRTRDAVGELEAACRLDPDDPGYRHYLGLGLGELNRLEDAEAAFLEAVRLDPRFGRAWYNLGLTRARLSKVEEALAAIGTAEEIEPESPEYPYARATVLYQIGRVEEAHAAATRALELAPDFEAARRLIQHIETGQEG